MRKRTGWTRHLESSDKSPILAGQYPFGPHSKSLMPNVDSRERSCHGIYRTTMARLTTGARKTGAKGGISQYGVLPNGADPRSQESGRQAHAARKSRNATETPSKGTSPGQSAPKREGLERTAPTAGPPKEAGRQNPTAGQHVADAQDECVRSWVPCLIATGPAGNLAHADGATSPSNSSTEAGYP